MAIRQLAERLARYKLPKRILVVDELPRNAMGKVQKTLLRARYCDPRIRGINKTDGLTWKVKEILDRATTAVAAGMRKL